MMNTLASWNPSAVLPAFMMLGADVVARAQSVPAGPAPFSIGWPGFLITLLSRNRTTGPHELPSTVLNVKTGYARTNRSATLEHLLRSHGGDPAVRGLTFTFLYTSQSPGTPAMDGIARGALLTTGVQFAAAAALHASGVASGDVLAIIGAGTVLSTAATSILRRQRQREILSARAVPENQRDVICITSGNGSSDVVIVVSEGGGVKLEDLAAGRADTFDAATTIGISALLVGWLGVLVVLTTLDAADALCVLALCVMGTAHATYAARAWRGGAAAGFKFAEERKTVVHADKVMQALMEAEEVESGVGLALLPVFFPGPLRPKEEEWWASRKLGVQTA